MTDFRQNLLEIYETSAKIDEVRRTEYLLNVREKLKTLKYWIETKVMRGYSDFDLYVDDTDSVTIDAVKLLSEELYVRMSHKTLSVNIKKTPVVFIPQPTRY
jgi:hypothetical protein